MTTTARVALQKSERLIEQARMNGTAQHQWVVQKIRHRRWLRDILHGAGLEPITDAYCVARRVGVTKLKEYDR